MYAHLLFKFLGIVVFDDEKRLNLFLVIFCRILLFKVFTNFTEKQHNLRTFTELLTPPWNFSA